MASQVQHLPQPARWSPGFVVRLPWLGLLALFGSACCIVATIIILLESDLQPVSQWTWQPNVYLNILSTVANFLLSFTFVRGVAIAWWVRASKADATIKDLHRIWSQGNSLLEALAGIRHLDWIAIASIMVVLSAVNGPLLQRASTTELAAFISDASVTLDMSLGLSLNWFTGYTSTRGNYPALFSSNFTPIVQNWTTGAPISHASRGCSGTCGPAKVRGLGFAVNCTSDTAPYNLYPISSGGSFDPNQPAVHGFDVFAIYFSWSPNFGESTIQLGVQYKNSKDCAGDLQIRNCTLRAALVDYPVIIDGNSSTIALDPSTNIFDDGIEDIYQSAEDNPYSGSPSLYGGIALALSNAYDAITHMQWSGAISYEIFSSGSTGLRYVQLEDNSLVNNCTLFFTDPTSDVLNAARELMFRVSVAAANTSNIQTIPMSQIQIEQVFASHYLFLGLAIAASTIGFLAATVVFFGYHRLGRSVSMSPIETAKAFGAPMLAGHDSNAKVTEIVRDVGFHNVRYGAVTLVNGSPILAADAAPYKGIVPDRLLFARPDFVRLPKPGDAFPE